jgi:hypothetical protein
VPFAIKEIVTGRAREALINGKPKEVLSPSIHCSPEVEGYKDGWWSLNAVQAAAIGDGLS